MATNLPSCFFIQFLELLLKFLVNFTLFKYVKPQRSYGFLITKELTFGFQILDLKRLLLSLLKFALKIRSCFSGLHNAVRSHDPYHMGPVYSESSVTCRVSYKPSLKACESKLEGQSEIEHSFIRV